MAGDSAISLLSPFKFTQSHCLVAKTNRSRQRLRRVSRLVFPEPGLSQFDYLTMFCDVSFFSTAIIVGILVGTLFWQTDSHISKISALFQSMFYACVAQMVSVTRQFPERSIYYKHQGNFYFLGVFANLSPRKY